MDTSPTNDVAPAQTTVPDAPMGRIWLIVLGSMAFVAIAGFMWHMHIVSQLTLGQKEEISAIKGRIASLQAYLDRQATTTTSLKR